MHGLTRARLSHRAALRRGRAEELLGFIGGSELIIHNAAFDVAFLEREFALLAGRKPVVIRELCRVLDTLLLARERHPGQRNSLDALCKRYDIDNSHRQLHGALLDARILADVYLAMTGGQSLLALDESARERAAARNSAMPAMQRPSEPLRDRARHRRRECRARRIAGAARQGERRPLRVELARAKQCR